MDLSSKHVVVVGLGRSGVAVARFLAKQGARVTVTDRVCAAELTDAIEALAEFPVRMTLGRHDASDFATADMVVVSPGVPHTLPMFEPAWANGIPVIGEIELAAAFIKEPILAITGTNGKTTTTTLVGEMLKKSGKQVFVGGNIGTPLIGYADGIHAQADILVSEISSFQLDTIAEFRPKTAVMLNITDDHLNRYHNFADYARSKWRVFENQQSNDIAIVNAMDVTVNALMEKYPPRARKRVYSDQAIVDGAQIAGDEIRIFEDSRQINFFSLKETTCIGSHNRENIAAACLAAMSHGATDEAVQQTIDNFEGLAHRMEPVGTVRGVHFVNDSKATNVDAVKRALTSFSTPLVLIMGGQNKKGDFSSLKSEVRKWVRALVAMGEAKEEIVTALAGDPEEGILEADSLEEAVERALEAALPGDTVLLSPACASFDMFDSYVHRGNRFREIVKGLE